MFAFLFTPDRFEGLPTEVHLATGGGGEHNRATLSERLQEIDREFGAAEGLT